jgi:GDP-4-dehydro-6-deoxy-D-mannose reductase
MLVQQGRPARPYNVCSGRAYRMRDLLDALVGRSHRTIDIVIDPSRLRPGDRPVIAGDRSRISAETGWTPEIPIERTLDDLLNYWRQETARTLTRHS